MLLHLFDAIEGLVDLAVAFETEGDGDDTNGQDAELLGDAGNDRGCTGTGTTAHTSCDKGHAGAIVEHALDVFKTLFCCLTGFLGLVAGTETFLAQLQMNGHRRIVESLVVCVAQHECHVVNAFTIHVVDSVSATTAYTNHFDDAMILFGGSEIEDIYIHIVCHNYSLFTVHYSLFTSQSSSSTIDLPNFLMPFMALFQKLFSRFSAAMRCFSASSSACF